MLVATLIREKPKQGDGSARQKGNKGMNEYKGK